MLVSLPSSETQAHRRLKALAVAWTVEAGYTAIADEVRLPRAPYRADIVAAPGICTAAEIPEGWGLLIENGGNLEPWRRPARVDCADPGGLLGAIARAGTRRLLKEMGVVRAPSESKPDQ